MSRKNLVLDSWSKNSRTSQNVRFFKLQYLSIELRNKGQFLHMVCHFHRSNKCFSLCFSQCFTSTSGCGQKCLGMPKVMSYREPAHLKNEMSFKVIFCMWQRPIQVTNSINNFNWVWSGMAKVVENKLASCVAKVDLGMNMIFAYGQAYIDTSISFSPFVWVW